MFLKHGTISLDLIIVKIKPQVVFISAIYFLVTMGGKGEGVHWRGDPERCKGDGSYLGGIFG